MLRVSAVYPNSDGSHFDGEDYVQRHAPFAHGLLDPLGLKGLRVTLGHAALDGAPPPYWAISELIFDNRPAFDAAMTACGEALFADAPNFTNVAPVLQVSILAES
ncbi:MAG: EthD family reductase [Sphingomonadaceae bacterium]|nr:EthD family reductase [Sphingomonadaceae bacterium]MBH1998114.1 EthD family reductase [Sphingomonadaceae bacterium]